MRYSFNKLIGEMTHGDKTDGRGNKEASTRWATSAKGQEASRNCTGCGRGSADRVHMEGNL
jgi:hypothetical protein